MLHEYALTVGVGFHFRSTQPTDCHVNRCLPIIFIFIYINALSTGVAVAIRLGLPKTGNYQKNLIT